MPETGMSLDRKWTVGQPVASYLAGPCGGRRRLVAAPRRRIRELGRSGAGAVSQMRVLGVTRRGLQILQRRMAGIIGNEAKEIRRGKHGLLRARYQGFAVQQQNTAGVRARQQ